MSKPSPVQPSRPGAAEADDSLLPVTPEVERIIRERLETFDEDAKAARPWEDVLADLKARHPLRHIDSFNTREALCPYCGL